MIEGILSDVVKLSPIFGLLIIAIIYLYKSRIEISKELKDERNLCHNEISSLNKEIRANEKENINIISKLSEVIDKMSDKIGSNQDEIREQLRDVKELIKDKINELKK